ncbi:MAG: bifunctional 3-(3-hydroxy-phenyl)propionate/3-hydroxycinnamic acid hydroxylase [Pseudomonadota bacterium]
MTNQSLPNDVDVLLVGLGPVGAAAANLLGRYGVRTLVIDKATDVFLAPRAIVLDNEALRILQMAGIEEGAFDTCAIAKVQMRSPLFGNYARANTAGEIDGHPKLVSFYQPQLERALRARLQRYPCVQTSLGTELLKYEESEQAVWATLRRADGTEASVRARYLVGLDGATSLVRRLAGLEFTGQTFIEDWLVVDAIGVPEPIDHVEFLCDPGRPTPHMVAPGNRQRWEFKLAPGETRAQMEDPAKVRELLAPWCDSEQVTIERTAVYRFHARIVERFSKGRVFLAGDAAHITPPFVGQGLVAGLRDVANLSWKLAWVVHGRAHASILDSYDQERRPHAKKIIRMALWMGRLVMPRSRLTALAVHGTMALLQKIPFTRPYFEELKIKPLNRFARGLFAAGRSRSRLVRGGLLPQGLVRAAPDMPCILSDEALGPHLTLVGFGCDPAAGLDAQLRQDWERAGGRLLRLDHRGHGGAWEDMTERLVPGAAPLDWVAVVRPDRTILHDGPAAQVTRLVSESLSLIGWRAPQPLQQRGASSPPPVSV